jgi:hypothetical protein
VVKFAQSGKYLVLAADYVFWPAVVLIAGCNLYFGTRIRSDRMAMQWGFDGEPTWYAPKAVGALGHGGICPCGSFADLGRLIIVAAVHVLTLRAASRAN